jgi:hypothetical protein
MSVPTSEQPVSFRAPIKVSPSLRLKREILAWALIGIVVVGGLVYAWTDEMMLRIARLAGHSEWNPPPIVTIEQIVVAGLVGASAGAGVGALVVAHRVGAWARTVNDCLVKMTQDINSWGEGIEQEIERIRSDRKGTDGSASQGGNPSARAAAIRLSESGDRTPPALER